MRCRIEWTSVRAPSAVCTTEMPSWALRAATLRPPTCERRPSEIARPAASSAARLMRKPDESFSSDLLRSFCVLDRLRYELTAAMFWLIERPMMIFLLESGRTAHPWAHPSDRPRPPGREEFLPTSFSSASRPDRAARPARRRPRPTARLRRARRRRARCGAAGAPWAPSPRGRRRPRSTSGGDARRRRRGARPPGRRSGSRPAFSPSRSRASASVRSWLMRDCVTPSSSARSATERSCRKMPSTTTRSRSGSVCTAARSQRRRSLGEQGLLRVRARRRGPARRRATSLESMDRTRRAASWLARSTAATSVPRAPASSSRLGARPQGGGEPLGGRGQLADPLACTARRPVHGAQLVDERAADPQRRVPRERHPGGGVVGTGGQHEREAPGGDQLVAGDGRRDPVQELTHGVPDEGHVREDEVIDGGCLRGHTESLGRPGAGLEGSFGVRIRCHCARREGAIPDVCPMITRNFAA